MRTLVKITIPVEAGNAAVRDGSLPRVIGQALEDLKPEAAASTTPTATAAWVGRSSGLMPNNCDAIGGFMTERVAISASASSQAASAGGRVRGGIDRRVVAMVR